jgi:hypothetical protein
MKSEEVVVLKDNKSKQQNEIVSCYIFYLIILIGFFGRKENRIQR